MSKSAVAVKDGAERKAQRSERAFGRYVAKHWRSYFPRLLSQSQFNQRARNLSGVLCALGPAIGMALREALGVPAYEVLDGVPVPLMRRCRGDGHRCFGEEASMGCGHSADTLRTAVRGVLHPIPIALSTAASGSE